MLPVKTSRSRNSKEHEAGALASVTATGMLSVSITIDSQGRLHVSVAAKVRQGHVSNTGQHLLLYSISG